MPKLFAPVVAARPSRDLLTQVVDSIVPLPDDPPAVRRRAVSAYLVFVVAFALFGGALAGYHTPRAEATSLVPIIQDLGFDLTDEAGAASWLAGTTDTPPTTEKERAAPAPPAKQLPLPTGKGMWIWLPERVHGGDAAAMVAQARATGLSHVYIRTGSSRMGFHGGEYLDKVLPLAHEAGIRVYGWDFPYLDDPGADVRRALTAVLHEAPGGHRIDGFVADIETPSEGTRLTGAAAAAYGHGLREAVGADYPLVVAVPRPSKATIARYPFDVIVEPFNAIAPMVYWLNRQPDSDALGAMRWLSKYGKPIIPVGQAYDGAPEGGRPGTPPAHEIERFMAASESEGAVGVSFWSWQHASGEIWTAIQQSPHFAMPASHPDKMRPADITSVQALIATSGYPIPLTGEWDEATVKAVKSFQKDAGLDLTGHFDHETRRLALQPARVPVAGRG